jgi:hypothetical protein
MPTEEEGRPRSAELEQAIRHRILERTGRRIRALEVEVVGDHIGIRGRTATFHLKQLALQALLEVIGTVGLNRIEHNIQVGDNPPKSDAEVV